MNALIPGLPLQQDTDVHLEEECLTPNEQQVSVPFLLKPCLLGFYSRIKNDGFFSPAKVFVGPMPSYSLFLTTLTTSIPPDM